MGRLAWKNLIHDKVRLAVTLTGTVFALVLILVQFGLFLGFLDTTSNVVAYSGADLWVAATGIPHVNGGSPIPDRRRYQVLQVPGVAQAEKHLLQFSNWKLPEGSQETVQVVGFQLDAGMGGPWQVTQGSLDDLRGEDTVMVDESYMAKLGVRGVGDTTEINGKRARVVGFTRGILSFTTAPYVFTSYKNGLNYLPGLAEGDALFLLVKVAPGFDPIAVRDDIRQRISGVDVFTNAELRSKTQSYWLFSTGAGVTTLLGAALGLLVGVVVVAQTIYASTVERIREFGTLKAMGAGNGVIYRVIILQAVYSALAGYAVAIVIGWFVAENSAATGAVILLPPEMAVGTLFTALAMCTLASVVSIRKATGIDPALVFRG